MRVPVRKWGNSLALRIPKAVAEDSRIQYGSVVEVSVVKGKMIVAPVATPRFSLEQLLARVTKKNRHAEVETGAPVGREASLVSPEDL